MIAVGVHILGELQFWGLFSYIGLYTFVWYIDIAKHDDDLQNW